MTTLQPLLQSKRDQSLDILRGFALAGVLFVYCVSDMGAPADHVNSFWDDLVAWPKWVLVENRMYNMLILIFGMGFSVQVNKARQKQESIVTVFLRRLTGLLIIGIIHAIVLSSRDILIFYAIAGFALLPARDLNTRGLMIVMKIINVKYTATNYYFSVVLYCNCIRPQLGPYNRSTCCNKSAYWVTGKY